MASSQAHQQPVRRFYINVLYVGVLILYVLAGTASVPFHGDESTIIYMSRDWYTLTWQHDLPAVLYSPSRSSGAERDDQNLRLLNGVVSKYSVGIMWTLAGFKIEDINGPWAWGNDWWVNRYYHQIPGDQLLFVSRMASALMTALSVVLAFAIGQLLGGLGCARVISFVYATIPSVLLNGRRTVFEGALLLTTALVIWLGLIVAKRYDQKAASRQLMPIQVGLGFAIGLALASKHTLLITIIPVLLVLAWVGRKRIVRTILLIVLSLAVAAGTFLLLNPAWWADPLHMPGIVLELRNQMLEAQQTDYGTFPTIQGQLVALISFPLGSLQYAEDSKYDWTQWIGDQISAYSRSGLAGIEWYRGIGILMLALLTGLWVIVRKPTATSIQFVAVSGFTAVALFFLNPLPWQRYYLPLALPLAGIIGLGLYAWWQQIALRLARAKWFYGCV